MTHHNKYSLGIYVNDWGFMMGSEGNPHVFLGLKIEKVQCNDMQIQMQENLYQHYLKHNMLEQANQCRINIEQMQCFVADKTLLDLQKELNKKYEYSITSSDEFQAWRDTILSSTESINKDFDKALRETFNNDFTFLRQCYADITEPFFIWITNTKNIDDDYLKTQMGFDEFENLFNEFVESKDSNVDSIEGFFGFGPYGGIGKWTYDEKYATGGKVSQNNHWTYKHDKSPLGKIERQFPKLPLNNMDKKYLIYAKEFILTNLRPLKTFQESFSEIIEINQNEYEKIAKYVLFQTLLSSDSIRHNSKIFGNEKNEFKNYKFVGNSCVDFVMDKLRLIGASKFDKATAISPYEVRMHIKDNKPNIYNQQKGIYKSPLSKGDRISYLLQDINLFYQNYDNLCKLDSTWESEKGFNTFREYYNSILHSHLLYDEKLNRLGKNKIQTLPRDNNIEHIENDINMRLNTGLCIDCYFQDILQYDKDFQCDVSLLCAKKLDNGKLRFLKADSSNDFVFSNFDFASDDTSLLQSYHLAMNIQQPIIFSKIPHYNVCTISKESRGTYIQSFMDKYMGISGNSGDYRDMIAYNKGTRNA